MREAPARASEPALPRSPTSSSHPYRGIRLRRTPKAARKLARLHARIANVRRDALHKATTGIVRRFDVIGIEDLTVRAMMANATLARAVADVGMFEFRRQPDDKAALSDARIIIAGRWYPSSKMCSDCGRIDAGLMLSDREWASGGCGVVHDRDRNAAVNLRSMAESSLAAASLSGQPGGSVTVCGAEKALALASRPRRNRPL